MASKRPGEQPPSTEWVPLQTKVERPVSAPPPPALPPPPVPRRRPSSNRTPVGGSSMERWDAVLVEVAGPATGTSHTVRGPLNRIGSAPGPGGLTLAERALLERVHAVLDLTGGHSVISPVGGAQVRVAERMEDLPRSTPLRGPVHVVLGTLVHLGPLHRGVTLRLDEVRRVGSWRAQALHAVAVTTGFHRRGGHAPDVLAPTTYAWVVRAAFAFVSLLGVSVAALAFVVLQRPVDPLGPTDETDERFRWVPNDAPIDRAVLAGMDGAFQAFVMDPNATAASWPELADDRTLWDQELLRRVGASATAHAKQWPFWRRLEAAHEEYATVVRVLREAGLPEVLAAIPFYESGYLATARGMDCELGYWQFLPEVAVRGGLVVAGCTLRGAPQPWTPTRLVPVVGVHKNAVYMDGGSCRIQSCVTDERADLARSAEAAARLLGEAWRDPTLTASGAAVQLTISSHNAGYDNSRFEERRTNPVNILPAYQRWAAAKGVARAPDFVGANIRCEKPGPENCGGAMWGYTQHYAYNVIAQHLLAVCYYARNHADDQSEFTTWRSWEDGYCRAFRVPSVESLKPR